eukprot:UN25219
MTPVLMSYALQDLQGYMNVNDYKTGLIKHPVAMVEGMCHLDFSPGYTHISSHFTTELTRQESQTAIGTVIGAFMNIQVKGLVASTQKDYQTLENYYNVAKKIISPYTMAATVQNSTWCGDFGQKTIMHVSDDIWTNATKRNTL